MAVLTVVYLVVQKAKLKATWKAGQWDCKQVEGLVVLKGEL